MEPFEYYVEKGDAKKVFPNLERAKALVKDSKERIEKASLLDINKFTKIIFENIYDAMRDLLDVILLLDGYKAYSHEAPISYLTKKGFDVFVIEKLDKFRFKRNGSKYYGEPIFIEDAKDIKEFYSQIKSKLYKLLNKVL